MLRCPRNIDVEFTIFVDLLQLTAEMRCFLGIAGNMNFHSIRVKEMSQPFTRFLYVRVVCAVGLMGRLERESYPFLWVAVDRRARHVGLL